MTSSMEEMEKPPKKKRPRSSVVLVDWISNLPESITSHILSFLPISDVVATSILSTRWRYQWTKVTTLNFIFGDVVLSEEEDDEEEEDEEEVRNFVQFVNKVLLHIGSQCLQKFLLKWRKGFHLEYGYVTIWASYAITRCDRVLVIDLGYGTRYGSLMSISLPATLFTCGTLEVLKLHVHFMFKVPGSVCLPKLEVLSRRYLCYESNECIPKLLRGCPVLHYLKMRNELTDSMRDFKVFSPSLRRLRMYAAYNFSSCCAGKLEIDAPKLEYLDLDERFEECSIKRPNSVNCVALDLHVMYKASGNGLYIDRCNSIVKLIEAVNHVKFLTLKGTILMSLCCATTPLAACFERLTKLDVHIKCCDWSYLGVVLGRATKLRVLNITQNKCFRVSHDLSWIDPTKVLECISSSLEKVSFVQFRGREDEMTMIKYILQHGEVLESFALESAAVSDNYKYKYQLLQHISTFPRFSRSCQIHFT